jgi:hypothetical protein
MKFLLILAVIAALYVLVVRKPAAPLAAPVSAAPTPASEVSAALKRPLDKTHDALEQVKKRNGDGEF